MAITTNLYNPATNPNVLANGNWVYGQVPTTPVYVLPFPPENLLSITDVFELSPFPQSFSAAGYTLDTDGTVFNGSVSYAPVAYAFGNKVPSGRPAYSATAQEGYAIVTNHTVPALENATSPEDLLDALDSLELALANENFPELNPTLGFELSFSLNIEEEDSNPHRAGFSLTLMTSDNSKGIELGFKENPLDLANGTHADQVFAQNANLNAAATTGEISSVALEISNTQTYKLVVQGNHYQLFTGNIPLLSGDLRDYNFNTALSDPPLPPELNPYAQPNLVAWGDNTDQGYAKFTMGAINVKTFEASDPPLNLSAQQNLRSQDGNADILMVSRREGRLAKWYMDGQQLLDTAAITPSYLAPNSVWQPVSLGNFDGQGSADVLWHNPANGNVSIWLVQNDQVTGLAGQGLKGGLNWTPEGVLDIDGDGRDDDILWRNRFNGAFSVWKMENGQYQGAVALQNTPVVGPQSPWEIEGFGDFNGDGHDDILWRRYLEGNPAGSRTSIWLMKGEVFQGITALNQESTAAFWSVKGVADANGDGHDDILWSHAINNRMALWELEGTSVKSSGLIQQPAAGWTPAGIG